MSIAITIGETELFDESSNRFYKTGGKVFRFEHSLKSISLWESKWHTPFLVDGEKTIDQTMDYLVCMCLDEGFTKDMLTEDVIIQLNDYVGSKHSATTLHNQEESSKKVITSELLYGYLAVAQIPYTVEDWNLDRLLKLVGSVSAINTPPKKMTQTEIMTQNKALNEQRRKELNSKG